MTAKTKFHNITPNVSKLYATVLPALGHDAVGAIADIWDNSDDAEAENIGLKIGGSLSKIEFLVFYDDGCGMDAATLVESFRFATDTQHSKGDLGKFGVGGTIGSFTLGKSKRTITKQRGGTYITGYQDLTANTQRVSNQVLIQASSEQEIELFKSFTDNSIQGTVIIIEKLNESAIDPTKRLKTLEKELIRKLGQKFRNRIKKDVRSFWIRGDKKTKLRPFDPLFRDTPENHTVPLSTIKIEHNGQDVFVRTVGLNFDLIDHKGIDSYENQGIYFVRNGREIIHCANDKALWIRHPKFNSGRVEISFGEDSDSQFNLTATKNKVSLQESLSHKIYEQAIKPFRVQLDSKWKKSSGKQAETVSKELEKFSNDLASSAGSLDLPRVPNSNGFATTIVRKPNENGIKGTVEPKGTGIKRKPKTKNRVVPQFSIENHPRSSQTHWYEIKQNEMRVIINSGTDFVRDIFINGKSETKKALKMIWAAECITAYSYYETAEQPTIDSFDNKKSAKVNEIYKHFN